MVFMQYMRGVPGASGFGSASTASEVAAALGATALAGKVAVVTGATSGIGVETARVLARYAATVVLACRNADATGKLIARIKAETPAADVRFLQLDLGALASVRAFAAAFRATGLPLHLLVNNAGVVSRDAHATTVDGWELMFGTNHLGHFLLTTLLVEHALATPPANLRVVFVSSEAHTFARPIDYDDLRGANRAGAFFMRTYGRSKLANLLASNELQRRYGDRGVTSVALHPGMIKTNLGNGGKITDVVFFFARPFAKSVEQGAATTLYAACAPAADVAGKYLSDCNVAPVAPVGKDAEAARALWEFSVKATEADANLNAGAGS